MEFTIRPAGYSDKEWIVRMLTEQWGSPRIVTRGKVHDALALPGFIAETDNGSQGLATYRIENGECEVVSLDSVDMHHGIGSDFFERSRNPRRERDAAGSGLSRRTIISKLSGSISGEDILSLLFIRTRWNIHEPETGDPVDRQLRDPVAG